MSDKPYSIYTNELLFTEHFLEKRVVELPEWNQNIAGNSDAHGKMAKLREKRNQVGDLANKNEAQLEEDWVQWIFNEILEIPYQVQVNLDYGENRRGVPDYVFTETPEQAAALTKDIYRPDELQDAIVVGDAKAWSVDLDKAKAGRAPWQQLDSYLNYSELPWGILTNGRYWRLYDRNSSKYNNYYMVDLDAVIEENDINQFLYFYLFFRREAFTENWLNDVLKGSKDYAETLRDSLEEQVFSALEDIAQGFLEYRRNRLEKPPSTETLNTIYEESLVLLYRLLFIFYAESRWILPTNNSEYRKRSLRDIAVRANHLVNFPNEMGADDDNLYSRLKTLFFLIDEGDDAYSIPAYNGKLFSSKDHKFLDDKVVGDVYLAQAVDKIARIEVGHGRNAQRLNVDYQDLEVSHLGTIYEKLLEYQLHYATENLVTSGKNQDYKKAKSNQTPTKKAGDVYLRTGNNQRKVTGSYYTPDYIVRFIVEKTLEPLLTDITEKYASRDDEGNWVVSDATALRDAILAVNVLDPATGSGHFAVDVVVYIAEWLLSLGLDLPELDGEADLSYWMRQVASSCIYAVDINPLAVELAKLSIWLKTLSKDKPLSFLNHHIRVGNSLVGASLAEIEDLAAPKPKKRTRKISDKQAPLFGEEAFTLSVKSAVGQMAQIEKIQADDISDVRRQELMYDELREKLKPYEQLANVWTAREFGLELNQGEWEAIYTLTLAGTPTRHVASIIEQAQKIADQRDMRFFHWDVAFPEVFFDADGERLDNPGFDAVVGNPPYVRQELITPIKPYLENYYDVYSGTADLFLYFFEAGLSQLKESRRLGLITSGTYMNSNSASAFRKYVDENAAFETLIDFGAVQPFRGVDMATNVAIAILNRTTDKKTFRSLTIEGRKAPESLNDELQKFGFDTLPSVTKTDEWRFQPKEFFFLFQKIMQNNPSLNDVSKSRIYSGIKTGLNEAFIVDENTKAKLISEHSSSSEILVPMLRGEDLRPFYQSDSGQYLVLTKQGINIEKYPAIKKYLDSFRERLTDRADSRNGQCEWYELRPCDYYEAFDSPKIIYPGIAKFPRYNVDTLGKYMNNSVYFITPSQYSIWTMLGLFQSRIQWFALSQMSAPRNIRDGLWRYVLFTQYIERLPIPDLTPKQESELATIAETITAYARQRYQLHENMRSIISHDFGDGSAISSRIDLYQWWNFADVDALNDDLSSTSRRNAGFTEIPLAKRGEWRGFFAAEKAKHQAITQQIIDEETRMNEIVYDAFKLEPHERKLIEDATKYPYGEV